MSDKVPTDYDKSDGWSDEQGCECCPHCGDPWSMNGGMQGPAFDTDGRKYDYYTNADPTQTPLFCRECWSELDKNRKQQENQTLTEWSE